MAFEAPYPPYDPTDKQGFSYETVVKRWPVIITSIIDHLHRLNHELTLNSENQEKITEAKNVIEKLSALKYHMGRDHALDPIPEDGEPHVEAYNSHIKELELKGKNTWFSAPWLFAECYLYRLVRFYFTQTTLWRNFDPFLEQKLNTFKSSGVSIYQLATTMREFEELGGDEEKLAVVFKEMLQMCLWGNATDLSLLTHLSNADIQNLQAVGRDAQASRKEYILRDDQDEAWNHLKSLREARVDFVLDNAGFELVTDLIFADFLVTYTPYVSKVVFHPKLIPWFVSDVTPPDFASTIPSLLDPAFFPSPPSSPNNPPPAELAENLNIMVSRWQKYLDHGKFALSVNPDTPLGGKDEKAEFWTSPWPYWDMREKDVRLWEDLKESGLVVFKGDLNYRKLTGDVAWPAHTPLSEAFGPLGGSFPILSLRTNKADVVVGVDKEVADALDAKGRSWRFNGKYALVSFLNSRGK